MGNSFMSDELTDMSVPGLSVLKACVHLHLEAIDELKEPEAPIFRRKYWEEILQDVNAELRRRDSGNYPK
jgi:hypothetical protein